MKIALITDTHFGARNDNLAFNDYFYKFWEEEFFPYVDIHDIKTVIHLNRCDGQTQVCFIQNCKGFS